MSYRFCSIEDVKPLANVDADFQDEDPRLLLSIKSTSRKIETFTRRSDWLLDEYRQHFSFSHYQRSRTILHLDVLGLREANDLPKIEFAYSQDNNRFVSLEKRYFRVDTKRNAVFVETHPWALSPRYYRVRYYAGYPVNSEDTELLDVPDEIRTACAVQAAFSYTRMINENIGVGAASNKTGRKDYRLLASGFVTEAQSLLQPYVRPLTGN